MRKAPTTEAITDLRGVRSRLNSDIARNENVVASAAPQRLRVLADGLTHARSGSELEPS